jgi:transcriptional regulator
MTTRDEKSDVLQGTLALMVLQTLKAMGPQHGYGIARRIEQVSGDAIALNQGTLYPALVRLEQQGWIRGRWGVSENNRKARFYALTASGAKQLSAETARWSRVAAIVGRFITPGDLS